MQSLTPRIFPNRALDYGNTVFVHEKVLVYRRHDTRYFHPPSLYGIRASLLIDPCAIRAREAGPSIPACTSPHIVSMDLIGLYTSVSPTATESTLNASPIKQEDGMEFGPSRKKQKRNKPTLSCEECVERKTKVSRPINVLLTCTSYQSGNKEAIKLWCTLKTYPELPFQSSLLYNHCNLLYSMVHIVKII